MTPGPKRDIGVDCMYCILATYTTRDLQSEFDAGRWTLRILKIHAHLVLGVEGDLLQFRARFARRM